MAITLGGYPEFLPHWPGLRLRHFLKENGMDFEEIERKLHKILVQLGEIETDEDPVSETTTQINDLILTAEQSLRRAKRIVMDNK
jgi:hypothetical protein